MCLPFNGELKTPLRDLDGTLCFLSNGKAPVISVLDASQDDIGARANFGRGNPPDGETAYDQFLSKWANIQVNRYNNAALKSCLVVGQVEISDLLEKCKGLSPSNPKERAVLIECVHEQYKRAKKIVKVTLQMKHRYLYYINGDHNNMANIISGFYEVRKVKPVVINLDFHSDARRSDDGPHSGTWLSDAYKRGEVAHSYIIGLSLLANSETVMENLEAFGTRFLDFTWDQIQMMGGSRVALPRIADLIIKDIHERFGKDYPVLFTIDGDTVQGLPCSA